MLGQDSYSFIHPEDISQVAAAHMANLAAHRTSRVTYRIRHKDGQYLWVETDARVILDDTQTSVLEIIAVSRDVTERTRIAQELEQSLGLLQATLESVANGIIAVDLDGEVVHYNQRFEQLWHLPAAWHTLPSQQERLALLTQQVHDSHDFVQRITRLMQAPQEDGYDIIALHDGRVIERYATPYRVGQRIAGRVWSFLDVTDRKRAEAELWASRARLRAIFDNAAVGVCLLDKDGHFIEFNECWVEFFGYSAAELPHLTHLDITPPDERRASAERFERLVSGAVSSYRLEKQYQRKDASRFWGDTSVTTIYNAQGEIEGIGAVVADITERRMSQEALQHANGNLLRWVNELEQRTYEMGLLNTLGEKLQECQTMDEAYRVAAQLLAQLFPQHTGALYVFDEARTTASQVATWGDTIAWQHACTPDLCHAWHEKPDYVASTRADLPCCCEPHANDMLVVCVPLVAQNETLGVLRIAEHAPAQTSLAQRWQQLGVTVAHHLALSLSNIHLRNRLREQAIHDRLTGLFNRRYLDEALEREVIRATRQQQPIGLIMLDIDHFKHFNTRYGHGGGDVILRVVGEFLRRNVRVEDTACRYGGEEFMLILPAASLHDTERRAEELRRGIERLTAAHNGEPLGLITASLGVACFPTHGNSAGAVVEAVSQALRQAKAQGRNRVVQASIDSPHAV
jgi:diguanylate cyclase (GGDEF)-like protein/PAS domain S-box-containing protein